MARWVFLALRKFLVEIHFVNVIPILFWLTYFSVDKMVCECWSDLGLTCGEVSESLLLFSFDFVLGVFGLHPLIVGFQE